MRLLSFQADQFLSVSKSLVGNDVMNSQATRSLRCVVEFLGNVRVRVRILACSEWQKFAKKKKKCIVKKQKQTKFAVVVGSLDSFYHQQYENVGSFSDVDWRRGLLLTAELSAALLPSAPSSDLTDARAKRCRPQTNEWILQNTHFFCCSCVLSVTLSAVH